MHFGKSVISIFLLFTFAIGFVNGLMPHCHESQHKTLVQNNSEFNTEHSHIKLHNHAEIGTLDEGYVLHDNHYDDSFLDYIVCLFTEFEHHKDIAHQIFIPLPQSIDEFSVEDIRFFAVLFTTYFDFKTNQDLLPTITTLEVNSHKGFVSSSPHRGPPIFSC